MSAASDYLENAVLDHVLGEGARNLTSPATLYVGLFTDSGSTAANLEAGTLTDEVSGNGYDRKTVDFDAASGGSTQNSATVTFDPASGGNWGEITHVAVLDAASAGNVLFYGAVTTPKTIEDGDTFQISTGNLTITLA